MTAVTQPDGGRRMTLAEHLEELRGRLIRSLLAVTAGFVVVWIWMEEVMAFLQRPLRAAVATLPPEDVAKVQLVQHRVGEAFMTSMKVAFVGGCVLMGPVILHQIWAFVAAGLYAHERKVVRFYALPGFVLFLAGAALAYVWVMPWALGFLLSFAFEQADVVSQLTLDGYVTLVAWGMFLFGLSFQLPVIMVFLMRLGVVEPATFKRHRRAAVVVIFILAAVLTPPDVVSQLIMAACLLVLFEGALYVGGRVARPRTHGEESKEPA
jgi:sec-independent protein translocase protein TatC